MIKREAGSACAKQNDRFRSEPLAASVRYGPFPCGPRRISASEIVYGRAMQCPGKF